MIFNIGSSSVLFTTLALVFASLCSAGHSGEMTYYEAGLGACGYTNSNNDYIAALNGAMYSLDKCGCNANVCHGSKCIDVKIVDKCPGCAEGDLDVTPTAFAALTGSLSAGRVAITWSMSCGGHSSPGSGSAVVSRAPVVVPTTQAAIPKTTAAAVVAAPTKTAVVAVAQTTPAAFAQSTTAVVQTTPAATSTSQVPTTTATQAAITETPIVDGSATLANGTGSLNATNCLGSIKQGDQCDHSSSVATCSGVYFAVCDSNNKWVVRSCSLGTVCKPFRAGFGCAVITANDQKALNVSSCPELS